MAEAHCRHMCMQPLRCGERCQKCWNRWIDPELVMQTLNQLQVRLELPRHLSEDLILLVRPGEPGVGARLAVVVAQILISRKEPNPIVMQWTAKIRREVTVLDAFVS